TYQLVPLSNEMAPPTVTLEVKVVPEPETAVLPAVAEIWPAGDVYAGIVRSVRVEKTMLPSWVATCVPLEMIESFACGALRTNFCNTVDGCGGLSVMPMRLRIFWMTACGHWLSWKRKAST